MCKILIEICAKMFIKSLLSPFLNGLTNSLSHWNWTYLRNDNPSHHVHHTICYPNISVVILPAIQLLNARIFSPDYFLSALQNHVGYHAVAGLRSFLSNGMLVRCIDCTHILKKIREGMPGILAKCLFVNQYFWTR